MNFFINTKERKPYGVIAEVEMLKNILLIQTVMNGFSSLTRCASVKSLREKIKKITMSSNGENLKITKNFYLMIKNLIRHGWKKNLIYSIKVFTPPRK